MARAQAVSKSPVGELPDRLHSIAIHLLRRLRTSDAASGLSAPKLSALSVLVFGGPRSLGELAAAEQVRPPSMSRLVRELQNLGLAAARPSPADRRAIVIRATSRGERLLQEGRSRRLQNLAAMLDTISEGERRTVARAVTILERILARG
jgi:DNA-binding MarR family transcriptional regulator